jgi:Sec-independent protein translocase protein TatA
MVGVNPWWLAVAGLVALLIFGAGYGKAKIECARDMAAVERKHKDAIAAAHKAANDERAAAEGRMIAREAELQERYSRLKAAVGKAVPDKRECDLGPEAIAIDNKAWTRP